MALWITDEMPEATGTAYGFPETWNGLGIVIDTFSNGGTTSSPQIIVLSNNGQSVCNSFPSFLLLTCIILL